MNTEKATVTETSIQPYLMFGGRCQEALDFYQSALGAKIEMVMLFKDSPDPTPPGMLPPGFENKVMHCSFVIHGSRIMASDGCEEASNFSGFSLSLSVKTEAEADQAFNALAEGGSVRMPLSKTFWSPKFGMLTDKFGVAWMIIIPMEMA